MNTTYLFLLRNRETMSNKDKLLKFLISSVAVFLTGMLLPGVDVSNVLMAIVIAAFLGLLNTYVKPLLVFLTIPVTFVTLGLFLIAINGFIILIIDWIMDDKYFHVRNFWWAVLFSLVLSFLTGLLERIAGVKNENIHQKNTRY